MKKIWILLCSMAILTGCGVKNIENIENPEETEPVSTDSPEPETTTAPSESLLATAQQTTTVSKDTTAICTEAAVSFIQAPETVPVEERMDSEKYRFLSGWNFSGDYVTDENGDVEPVYGNAILTIGDGNYLVSFPKEADTRVEIRLCNLVSGELARMTVDAQPTLTHTGFWTLKLAAADEPAVEYQGKRYSKIQFYSYNFQLARSLDISTLERADHLFYDETKDTLYAFTGEEERFVLKKRVLSAAEFETAGEWKRTDTAVSEVEQLHYTSWGFLFTGKTTAADGEGRAAYGVISPDVTMTISGISETADSYGLAPFWEGAYIYGEQCETGKVLRLYGGAEQTITLSHKPSTAVFSASPSGAYLIAGDVVLEQKEKRRNPRLKSTLYQYWQKYYWLLAYDSGGTLIGKSASIGAGFEKLENAEASRDLEDLRFQFFYDEQRAEVFYAADREDSGSMLPIGGMMECMDMRTIDKLPFGEKESEDET
ncbi:MAG: hypothetical protein IKL87_05310 [Oscillospiraceae bacterium]|nr:hypothetical protein [Oscillospiraceae bacterium]